VMKEITTLLDENEPAIDLLLSLGTDEHHAWFYEKLRHFIPTSSFKPPTTTDNSPTSPTSPSKKAITDEEGRSYNHYHRFEIPDIKLGWRKKHFLTELEAATEKWLSDPAQQADITRYAQTLVERRRARAATARWETFALGVRYVCFHEECAKRRRESGGGGEMELFTGRGDFFDHLDRRHDLMRLAARGVVKDVEAELDRGRRFGCT